MEERIETHVFLQVAQSKRQFVRSDGALYVLLLFFVFGVILLGNRVSERYELSRFYVQITMYLLLLGAGYWVYRTQLTAFRYTATDRVLNVTRLVGRKERAEVLLHLSDITSIRPFQKVDAAQAGRLHRLYSGTGRDLTAIAFRENGNSQTLLLALSPENTGKLIAAWKKSLK